MLTTIFLTLFILTSLILCLLGIGILIKGAIDAIKDRSFPMLAVIIIGLLAIVSRIGLFVLGV